MFSHLKVIDFSTVLAGPSVATFFAELGAQVIKIENVKSNDVTRTWRIPNERHEITSYFASINFQKSYRFLNLKDAIDSKQMMELLEDADIAIMNYKKDDDVKLGLQSSELRKRFPKLILGKINGFGADSDRVAYDLILQAETGFMSMNGNEESGPLKMPVALIDVLAAHHLKEGLLLAILDREKTGMGRTVEVSLYDAAVCSLANQASNYLMNNNIPQRIGSLHPNIAPYGELFNTKDRKTVTFAIGSNQQFELLCTFLELPELPKDQRFAENVERVRNREILCAILTTKIMNIEADYLSNQMQKLFIPMGIVRDLKEVFENNSAKQLIREEVINDCKTSRVTQIGFKWK